MWGINRVTEREKKLIWRIENTHSNCLLRTVYEATTTDECTPGLKKGWEDYNRGWLMKLPNSLAAQNAQPNIALF